MSATMKILILTGSPHKQGTSNTLVQEFVRGAEEAGHQITIYDCASGNINPCLGCDCCGTSRRYTVSMIFSRRKRQTVAGEVLSL